MCWYNATRGRGNAVMSSGGNGYDSALISSRVIHVIRYSSDVSALCIISIVRLTILVVVLRT